MNAQQSSRYTKLVENQRFWSVPANVHAAITGAVRASQDNTGRVILEYADGSSESALFDVDMDKIADNWLGLVSAVQAKARAVTA